MVVKVDERQDAAMADRVYESRCFVLDSQWLVHWYHASKPLRSMVTVVWKSGSQMKHDRCTGVQDKMTPPGWKTKAAGVKVMYMRGMWRSTSRTQALQCMRSSRDALG